MWGAPRRNGLHLSASSSRWHCSGSVSRDCLCALGLENPPLTGFAVALLEGFVAAPYALGDRIATLALLLRPLGAMYFAGFVAGWAIVTLVVVLPASIVAGVQFPLLIALMGQGKKEVGEQTGWVYAANTGGSIAGALAGGFGLLPMLSVIGCWKLAAGLLAVVGLGAALRPATTLDAPLRGIWPALGAIAISCS
jgi:hypothetical protein